MTKYTLLILSSCALLASCGEPTKAVSEFKADEEARIATLQKCRENTGEWDTTPNCGNAEAATLQMIEEAHQAQANEAKPLQDQIRELSTECTGVPREQWNACRESNGKAQAELMAKSREIASRFNALKQELSTQIARN